MKPIEKHSRIATAIELGLRLGSGWSPTATQLQSELGISRASAYRWMRDLRAARRRLGNRAHPTRI